MASTSCSLMLQSSSFFLIFLFAGKALPCTPAQNAHVHFLPTFEASEACIRFEALHFSATCTKEENSVVHGE